MPPAFGILRSSEEEKVTRARLDPARHMEAIVPASLPLPKHRPRLRLHFVRHGQVGVSLPALDHRDAVERHDMLL
jgi:hypothetical protein